MNERTFTDLMHNTALLLAMAVIFDAASSFRNTVRPTVRRIVLGIVLGGIGLAVMLTPWHFTPGIVFDTRSILLSISGLFFGLIPTGIASVTASAFRLYQGGAGTVTGICVIISTGAVGVLWRYFRRKPMDSIKWYELYIFGLIVHVVMLALMFTLPGGKALTVLSNISLPVLIIYPAGTAMLGLLMVNRLHRERINEALKESEERFRSLFENMAEGVALHEIIYNHGQPADYKILDINPAYEKYTGISRNKILGKRGSKIYAEDPPPFLDTFAKTALDGKPRFFETYFQPAGKYFAVSAVSPKRGFLATVVEDITDRKRKQKELQQKNEELERFTYTVSHDLKSPLITIKGFAGSILRDLGSGRSERLESDLKRIEDAADKMGELLNDLLELSRIGRMVNPPTFIDMNKLTEEVVELLSGVLQEQGVVVTVAPGFPAVRGDRQRIKEVWQNLVENAVKFMGGQPRPKIEIGWRTEENVTLFYVKDNGMGIDPQYHETIFGLFNKLETDKPGTGIGLALVKRIIDFHHGKLWVESEGRGTGTTVCFTLPIK